MRAMRRSPRCLTSIASDSCPRVSKASSHGTLRSCVWKSRRTSPRVTYALHGPTGNQSAKSPWRSPSATKRAPRDEKLRAKVAETRIMIDEWQHARDRRDRYTREMVPLAHERTLATLVAYRGGKATLAEVLAARRVETE